MMGNALSDQLLVDRERDGERERGREIERQRRGKERKREIQSFDILLTTLMLAID